MSYHLAFIPPSLFNFNKKATCILIHIALLIISSDVLYSQANIALQNFEGSGNNYNYTNTNGVLQSGNSTSSDRPAAMSFYASTNTGFRATNTTATLSFENITGLSIFNSKKIMLRLAAFSINSPSNGMDAGDKVTISVSLNGGTSYSDELTVKGFSNAYWHYTTGTGIAMVNYDGNNSATEFAPGGGGNRTTDGYSTMILNLPDSCTQVQLKIVMSNDSNNEAWLIDDIVLNGCKAPSFAMCPSNFTINTDTNQCKAKMSYTATATGNPNPTFSYVYSGSTSKSGSGTGSPGVFNLGITIVSIKASSSCGSDNCSFQISVIPFAIHNIQSDLYYCSLQDAISAVETSNGDELQLSDGIYFESCIELTKEIKLTPLLSGIEIPCLKMSCIGKFMILGGDLNINQLTLTNGKIRTNGHKLLCGSISGGNSSSYIITD